MFVQRRRNKEVERSNKMYYFDLNDLKKKEKKTSVTVQNQFKSRDMMSLMSQ